MKNITNILWDINGVLINDIYIAIFEKISKEKNIELVDFMQQIRADLSLLETGFGTEKDFFVILKQKYKLKENTKEIEKMFKQGYIINKEL